MTDNYIITLECSRDALGELIATGLEQSATITTLKSAETKVLDMTNMLSSVSVHKPSEVLAPSEMSNDQANSKKIKRRLSSWEVYEVALNFFPPYGTFTSQDLDAAISLRYERKKFNSASAHLHHFNRLGIVERIDGTRSTGYVYVIRKNLKKLEFQKVYNKAYGRLEGLNNGR